MARNMSCATRRTMRLDAGVAARSSRRRRRGRAGPARRGCRRGIWSLAFPPVFGRLGRFRLAGAVRPLGLPEVAARHRQGDAGDVGGLVGGQEQDRRRLLVERAVAAACRLDAIVWSTIAWYQAFSCSACGAPGCAGCGAAAPRCRRGRWRRRGCRARRTPRRGGGERVDAALGRRIGHAVDAARGDRRDVDDHAAALPQHGRQHRAAAPQRREQRAADLGLDLRSVVIAR